MVSRAADGASAQELDLLSLRSQLGPLAAVSVLHSSKPCYGEVAELLANITDTNGGVFCCRSFYALM